MKSFPENIRFKYPWRQYQQRVLHELDNYLSDKHLHVVAPPGSGKTILGLEIMLRLDNATLILTPSIAIRNQWVQRFCELFLQTALPPEWLSTNIRQPAFLTITTYQGLYAACNDSEEEPEYEPEEETSESADGKISNRGLSAVTDSLKKQGVQTIIVDEAHHLMNEWWQSLNAVKKALNPVIVGLTATPPYDVSFGEWERYIELNGPADTEISMPELVTEGDLCPHQDYIYFTTPSPDEQQKLATFRKKADDLFQEIARDPILLQAIQQCPLWTNPQNHMEWLYSHFSTYSSCIIFLKTNGIDIPLQHREITGEDINIPDFDIHWASLLLEFYLYTDNPWFETFKHHRQDIADRLKDCGALEKKQIDFESSKKNGTILISNASKLQGIREITDFEFRQMGQALRLVILTDYIRKEYIPTDEKPYPELNKIGVIPIFEILRLNNADKKKIGILTGSLMIIPKAAYNTLKQEALLFNIVPEAVPLSYDESYLELVQTGQNRHLLIQLVTKVFQKGDIEVLIGTKSLLGEGWDAPEINTLILASVVGSFVLSNQMRGRAIRSLQHDPCKTGNIWHLACIDRTSKTGGPDFELLQRRFKTFVGIGRRNESGISAGIERLYESSEEFQIKNISEANKSTFSYAAERSLLKQRWTDALNSGNYMAAEIRIPFRNEKAYTALKRMHLKRTLAYLIAELSTGMLLFVESYLRVLFRKMPSEMWFKALTAGCIIGLVLFGRKLYRSARLYLYYRDIALDIENIGKALLTSFINEDIIKTNPEHLTVIAAHDNMGAVSCHLKGGTTFEQSVFINALKEITDPVDNPRYLILRMSKSWLTHQTDYHAVPENIGRNKKSAEYFYEQWTQHVGTCTLEYTRTPAGREMLLKARSKALSAQFAKPSEHTSRWV